MFDARRPLRRRVIAAVLLCASVAALAGQSRRTLPAALSDQEFWALTERFSEPNGYFRSNSGSPDNLLSNEGTVSTVAGWLAETVAPGGVYLGVGPEQNFTYIAATRPKIAIVTDIRRGNLQLHLLYKALFEMSATRADFVGRLFTRARPAGLTTQSTAAQLMNAYLQAAPGDATAFSANLKAVADHLMKTRRLPLAAEDLAGIEYVYENFHRFGPAIHYTSSIGRQSGPASYAQLMRTTDRATGTSRTYLATEENYARVKAMQSSNLIVPIVGDFAGPKALRSVGAFLRERGATVTMFYVSNVEQYLQRNGVWRTFCANVASLPLDAAGIFIRPDSRGGGAYGSLKAETAACGR